MDCTAKHSLAAQEGQYDNLHGHFARHEPTTEKPKHIDMKTELQNATGLFSKHFMRPLALLAGLLLLAATSGWTQDYLIDFETETSGNKTGYATGTVKLSGLDWEMTQALIGTLDGDKKFGDRSARMRRDRTTPGEMVMLEDKPNGIGTISFYYARYGTETAQPNLTVQYSLNQGADWDDIGTISDFPADLAQYSADINIAGNVRLRFITDLSGTNRSRLNIDNISVTDYVPTDQVATPSFDPGTGTYYASFEVEITTATEDATINYSFVSDEGPWTEYDDENRPNISETTTIWAYAEKAGMDDSSVASAEYTFPTEVATIEALQDIAEIGGLYRITGEVFMTYQNDSRNQKFFQDALTGGRGIKIDDNNGHLTTILNIGDGITNLTGTIGQFNRMIQFTPAQHQSPASAHSTGNNLTPFPVTLAEIIDENNIITVAGQEISVFQALLIEIEDLQFEQKGDFDSGTAFGVVPISDPTASLEDIDVSDYGVVFRVEYSDLEYNNDPIPTSPVNLTAIVDQRFEDARIFARNWDDFEILAPTLTASPSTLSGFSYVAGSGPSGTQSFELSGINLDPGAGNITLNTGETGYEISVDNVVFGSSLQIPYSEGALAATTIYVRLKADLEFGLYNDKILSISGGDASTTLTLNGEVGMAPQPGYLVDFEGDGETKPSYASGTVNLNGLNWNLNQAIIGVHANDIKNGNRAARIRLGDDIYGSLEMLEAKPGGVGDLVFYYSRSNFSGDRIGDAPVFVVEYKVDNGSWTQIGGTVSLADVNELTMFHAQVNKAGDVKLRIRQVAGGSGKRWNVDDIFIADYTDPPPPLPGLPYAQDFSEFAFDVGDQVDPFGEGWEWRFQSSGRLGTYQGDWGDGDTPGFRGNAEVLGYQHDLSTGLLTVELKLTNDTGSPITTLGVSYTGRVAKVERSSTPAWTVRVNGQLVNQLYYSTLSGVNQERSVVLERLNIAPGETITLSWQSHIMGAGLPPARQIGISDVTVEALEDPTRPLRFEVSDGADPIAGAQIYVSALGSRALTTNSSGVASTRLRPGSYRYDVYAYTYQPVLNGRFEVTDDGAVVEVVMDAEEVVAQGLPWTADFEDFFFPPPLWRKYALGGQSAGWMVSRTSNTGSQSIYHRRITTGQEPVDSWLVSPPIALPAGENIRMEYFERNMFMSHYTYGGVWISTGSGDPASGDFVELYESDQSLSSYTQTGLDLDAYAGQVVYLAFVYQGLHGHSWWVDDIHIYGYIPEYAVDLYVEPEEAAVLTGEGIYARGEMVSIGASGEPGYDFLGWHNGEGELFSADAETTFEMPDHALNLTARYELQTFVVGAYAGFGGRVSPDGEFFVEYGSTVSFVFTPFEGYEVSDVLLDGVSLGAKDEYVLSDITQNHDLEVKFSVRAFTLAATSSEGGSLDPEGNILVPYFGSQVFTVVPDSEYHEWTLTVDGEDLGQADMYVFEEVVSDHQIHVEFTIETFTITAEAGEGGVISPAGAIVVPFRTSQEYRIIPNPGFHVRDVLVDGESVGPVTRYTFEDVSSDHRIQALFERNRYTITATSSPGGQIDPMGQVTVDHGSRQEFVFVPDAGSYLLYVEVDGVRIGAPDNHVFPAVTRNHRIHAQFAYRFQELSLVAEPLEGGRVIGSGFYPLGWDVSILAAPHAGYRFDRWTDANGDWVSDSPMHVYTMPDEDMVLTAHFVPRTFELTLSPRPAEGGSVEGGGSYAAGEQVLLTATAAQGYAFVNWTAPGGLVVSQEASFTYPMPAVNIHLRANFSATGKQETMAGGAPLFPGMEAPSLRLYPNPVGDVLHVESESAMLELRLYDLMGRQVYAASPEQAHYHQLAVGGLPGGIYLIRALTSDGWTTGRVQVSAW